MFPGNGTAIRCNAPPLKLFTGEEQRIGSESKTWRSLKRCHLFLKGPRLNAQLKCSFGFRRALPRVSPTRSSAQGWPGNSRKGYNPVTREYPQERSAKQAARGREHPRCS
jgi:hypothetical protein